MTYFAHAEIQKMFLGKTYTFSLVITKYLKRSSIIYGSCFSGSPANIREVDHHQNQLFLTLLILFYLGVVCKLHNYLDVCDTNKMYTYSYFTT